MNADALHGYDVMRMISDSKSEAHNPPETDLLL
jgi:hypothetical protein